MKIIRQNSELKIKDIASTVNIGKENYFYTLFKKYNGISPSNTETGIELLRVRMISSFGK
ncbi:MAG: AraC family transcriptional regulator [Clostridia bacterium]|nr:AraC family transcriptional regulator [Clostridia bacterium]